MPCREHLAQLRERQAELDRLSAVVLAVTFQPPDDVARFVQAEGLPYPVLSDPSRRAYEAFGLSRGRPEQIWTWSALKAYLRGLLGGRRPRPPRGDLAQLGGDFVLDRTGAIVFAYRSRDVADRPSVAAILDAVRTAANAADREERS